MDAILDDMVAIVEEVYVHYQREPQGYCHSTIMLLVTLPVRRKHAGRTIPELASEVVGVPAKSRACRDDDGLILSELELGRRLGGWDRFPRQCRMPKDSLTRLTLSLMVRCSRSLSDSGARLSSLQG